MQETCTLLPDAFVLIQRLAIAGHTLLLLLNKLLVTRLRQTLPVRLLLLPGLILLAPLLLR
ncbi:MAG TPA: hypothetical protein VJX67_05195 [Blastocatellia bacterium]|nr:hypothetical protein [Blastocatellia bacterium]